MRSQSKRVGKTNFLESRAARSRDDRIGRDHKPENLVMKDLVLKDRRVLKDRDLKYESWQTESWQTEYKAKIKQVLKDLSWETGVLKNKDPKRPSEAVKPLTIF